VLVDTFLSEAQTGELADWIDASGRRLSTIYITHAHPDHFFGLKLLRDRFPDARAITPAQVADAMQATLAPEAVENWRRIFPGQSPQISSPLNGWIAGRSTLKVTSLCRLISATLIPTTPPASTCPRSAS
jgi:glyoxylase-like metal-dependent hydrolase (beta-lactamase superfamily II)